MPRKVVAMSATILVISVAYGNIPSENLSIILEIRKVWNCPAYHLLRMPFILRLNISYISSWKKINIKGKNSSCDECNQTGKLGCTCKYTLRKALKNIKQMKIWNSHAYHLLRSLLY